MTDSTMSEERHKIRAAVYLILRQDGDVLLLRRFNTGWQDGNYSLVSGHIDGDESFSEAMLREAKEEAGIDIAPEDLKFAHAQHRTDTVDSREYIDMYFSANRWKGEVTNMEPRKCDQLKFFPFEALPENIVPGVRGALEGFKKGSPYSEFGW